MSRAFTRIRRSNSFRIRVVSRSLAGVDALAAPVWPRASASRSMRPLASSGTFTLRSPATTAAFSNRRARADSAAVMRPSLRHWSSRFRYSSRRMASVTGTADAAAAVAAGTAGAGRGASAAAVAAAPSCADAMRAMPATNTVTMAVFRKRATASPVVDCRYRRCVNEPHSAHEGKRRRRRRSGAFHTETRRARRFGLSTVGETEALKKSVLI